MSSVKSVFDLRFQLLERNKLLHDQASEFESAFEMWRQSWQETFEELGVDHRLYSDDFLSREVGCVFSKDQPVGMVLFCFFDLNRRSDCEHSYFKCYPNQVIDYYRRIGHVKVMAAGYMTVNHQWRRSETDVPLSEVLVGLTAQRFLESDASAMISYLRNNKKANEMFYRHGGVPVLKGVTAHNVEVDFAFISRHSAKDSEAPGVADAVRQIWSGWKFQEERLRKAG